MTDIEMDLMMAKAEVLCLQQLVRDQADKIANQSRHIAALQNMIEHQQKLLAKDGASDG